MIFIAASGRRARPHLRQNCERLSEICKGKTSSFRAPIRGNNTDTSTKKTIRGVHTPPNKTKRLLSSTRDEKHPYDHGKADTAAHRVKRFEL